MTDRRTVPYTDHMAEVEALRAEVERERAIRKESIRDNREKTETVRELLAEVDTLHNTLSGPATVVLLRRAWQVYGDSRVTCWRE